MKEWWVEVLFGKKEKQSQAGECETDFPFPIFPLENSFGSLLYWKQLDQVFHVNNDPDCNGCRVDPIAAQMNQVYCTVFIQQVDVGTQLTTKCIRVKQAGKEGFKPRSPKWQADKLPPDQQVLGETPEQVIVQKFSKGSTSVVA